MKRMIMASAVGHVFIFLLLVIFSVINLGSQRPKLRRYIRVHTVAKKPSIITKATPRPVVKSTPKPAPTPKPKPKKVVHKPKKKKTPEKKAATPTPKPKKTKKPKKTPAVKKKEKAKPTPTPKKRPKPRTEKKPPKQPKPISTPRQVPMATPAQPAKTPAMPVPEPPTGVTIEKLPLPEYYLENVRGRIEDNFKVPQHLKGLPVKCRVGFTVLRDGIITNIELIESSNSEVLDKIARQALETTQQVGPLPDSYRENSVRMTITFDFNI